MRFVVWMVGLAMFVGCKKAPPATGPAMETDALLEHLSSREVPEVVRSRFSVRLRSKPLGINPPPLGGGVVLERPDRLYLAIMNPVGGVVVSATSDGRRLLFLNQRDRQAFVDEDLVESLAQSTEGQLSPADVVDVFLGLLPVEARHLQRTRREGEQLRMRFQREGGVALTAWVDPVQGTPRRLVLTKGGGRPLVEVTYEPFASQDGEPLLPTRMVWEVPAVELSVDLRFRSWSILDGAPDVFAPEIPDRFEVRPMSAMREGVDVLDVEASAEGEPER